MVSPKYHCYRNARLETSSTVAFSRITFWTCRKKSASQLTAIVFIISLGFIEGVLLIYQTDVHDTMIIPTTLKQNLNGGYSIWFPVGLRTQIVYLIHVPSISYTGCQCENF